MAYLFMKHDMAVEKEEFSLPPPALREAYGPEFKCNRCGAPGLRWWRNPDDKPLPLNGYGFVHTCGSRRDGN